MGGGNFLSFLIHRRHSQLQGSHSLSSLILPVLSGSLRLSFYCSLSRKLSWSYQLSGTSVTCSYLWSITETEQKSNRCLFQLPGTPFSPFVKDGTPSSELWFLHSLVLTSVVSLFGDLEKVTSQLCEPGKREFPNFLSFVYQYSLFCFMQGHVQVLEKQ